MFVRSCCLVYHLRLAIEEQSRLRLRDFVEGDHTLTTAFQGVRSPGLAFTPDGRRFVLYDATAIVFSPDGRFVAVAHENGEVKIWDTMREQHPVSLPHNGHVNALIFSANGQYLAIASYGGSTRIWEWNCSTNVVLLSWTEEIHMSII
jgi:WD40 repeat protein